MRTLLTAAVLVLVVHASPVSAQTWRPPADNQRCPSRWGAGDQRGSGNHMKPETVLRAARLIQAGEVFEPISSRYSVAAERVKCAIAA